MEIKSTKPFKTMDQVGGLSNHSYLLLVILVYCIVAINNNNQTKGWVILSLTFIFHVDKCFCSIEKITIGNCYNMLISQLWKVDKNVIAIFNCEYALRPRRHFLFLKMQIWENTPFILATWQG